MIKDLPSEIHNDLDWQSGLREFRDEMEPTLYEAVDWVCQTHNIERTDALVEAVETIILEDDWFNDPNSVMSYHHY